MNKPLLKAELVPVDGGVALVLPAELIARLDAAGTGQISLVEGEDGSIRLEPFVSEFDRQMALGREIIARRKHALSVLAK